MLTGNRETVAHPLVAKPPARSARQREIARLFNQIAKERFSSHRRAAQFALPAAGMLILPECALSVNKYIYRIFGDVRLSGPAVSAQLKYRRG